MFNIGFTEILVVALVSLIVIDKEKVPIFIRFFKVVYRYALSIKFKTKKFLRDAGIEELCNAEDVSYIIGKDGKLYPSYNIDNTSDQGNTSYVYDENFLEERTTGDVIEKHRRASMIKLPSENKFRKRSNDSKGSCSR